MTVFPGLLLAVGIVVGATPSPAASASEEPPPLTSLPFGIYGTSEALEALGFTSVAFAYEYTPKEGRIVIGYGTPPPGATDPGYLVAQTVWSHEEKRFDALVVKRGDREVISYTVGELVELFPPRPRGFDDGSINDLLAAASKAFRVDSDRNPDRVKALWFVVAACVVAFVIGGFAGSIWLLGRRMEHGRPAETDT